MGDDKRQRNRDDRETSSPPVGSVSANAIGAGAEMLDDLPSERAVPEAIFEDIKSTPHALPIDKMAKREERIKSSAFDSRENLERTKGIETTVERLLGIVEKQAQAQAARDLDEIEGKQWWRATGTKVIGGFISGGGLAAIIAVLTRGC